MKQELQPFIPADVTPGTRTVLVSRHGRTTGNTDGVMQNWSAHTLTVEGRNDVIAAKRWWDMRAVNWVVSSPLFRATLTAELLFDRIDEIDAAWVEQASPIVQGRTIEEAHKTYPELIQENGWAVLDAPYSMEQEHIRTVEARATAALARTATMVQPGQTVAVVTHGAIVASLARLGGYDTNTVDNLAVVEVSVDPLMGWRVVALHHPLSGDSASTV